LTACKVDVPIAARAEGALIGEGVG
jgi:hypothetical protein